jgi:hypothetical protein
MVFCLTTLGCKMIIWCQTGLVPPLYQQISHLISKDYLVCICHFHVTRIGALTQF